MRPHTPSNGGDLASFKTLRYRRTVSPAAAERPAARGALGALGVMGHHPDPGRRAAVRGRRPRATSLAMAVLVLACSSAFTPPQPGVPGMARRPGAKPRLRPGSSWTAPPVSGIALLLRTTRHGHNEKRVGAASVRMIGGVTTAKDGDSPNRNLGVGAAASSASRRRSLRGDKSPPGVTPRVTAVASPRLEELAESGYPGRTVDVPGTFAWRFSLYRRRIALSPSRRAVGMCALCIVGRGS